MLLALRAAKREASLNDDETFSEIGARWTIRATRAHASGPMSLASDAATGFVTEDRPVNLSGVDIGLR